MVRMAWNQCAPYHPGASVIQGSLPAQVSSRQLLMMLLTAFSRRYTSTTSCCRPFWTRLCAEGQAPRPVSGGHPSRWCSTMPSPRGRRPRRRSCCFRCFCCRRSRQETSAAGSSKRSSSRQNSSDAARSGVRQMGLGRLPWRSPTSCPTGARRRSRRARM
jgi:hypothetical protein